MPIKRHPHPKRDQDDNGHNEFGEDAVAHFAFAFSPSSTKRRIASERVGVSGWLSAHFTIAARVTGSARNPTIGVTPVAGRPRNFCLADIVFFIISV
jgi:hypothetical protein